MRRPGQHGHLVSARGKLLREARDHDGITRELGRVLDAEDQQAQGILVGRAAGARLRSGPPFRRQGPGPTACGVGRGGKLLENPLYLLRALLPGKLRGARQAAAGERFPEGRVREHLEYSIGNVAGIFTVK